jgi:serine phosphatase RsbU (regulator of sigma subunit)
MIFYKIDKLDFKVIAIFVGCILQPHVFTGYRRRSRTLQTAKSGCVILEKHRELGAAEWQKKVLEAVTQFSAGDFQDDITLMTISVA